MKKSTIACSAMIMALSLVATPALSATKAKKPVKTTKKIAAKGAATTVAPAASTPASTAAPAPITTAAPAATGDVDPNGTLRIASSLLPPPAGNLTTFDPIRMPTPAVPIHGLVYDTLLRWSPDGTFKPGLAKSATVTGESSLSLELQPNVKFSDGTPFDAAAVKAGLERNATSNNTGAFSNELRQLDTVTVESPTKLSIRLKTPISGAFYFLLSRGETMIVSPAAVAKGQDLNSKPVGAGPFMVESISPEQKIRLVKNPTYFQADRVRLAAVEYIHVNDPTASTNALLSGAADAADVIQAQTERALRGNNKFTTIVKASEAVHMWAQICKSSGPLADVRVRQALNYGIDREAVNRIVYEGKGEVMDALVPTDSILYDKKYKDYYKRNIDKAKKLLADAGYPNGLTLEFFYTAGDSQTASEVIQQQLKDIGVNLNLAITNNAIADFFVTPPATPKRPGQFFPLTRTGLDKITRNLQPGSIGNICQYNDEELNKVIELIRAKDLSEPATKREWNLMTDIVLEKALNIFVTFGVSRNVYNDKVGNPSFILNFQGIPFLDISSAYKKR